MKYGVFFALVLTISAFTDQNSEFPYPDLNQTSFLPGERIEYKLNFSFFTVGKGQVVIHEQVHSVNQRPSYKVDVYGKTSGVIDWIAQVDDHWGAYIDTASLLPHQSYRNIKEGRYRKNEIVRYDHAMDMIEVKTIDRKTGEWKEPEFFYHPGQRVFDLLGGMLYFRSIDFEELNPGDTINVHAFFEDKFYDFKTLFEERDIVSTKLGKFRSLVLRPIMPDNELFDGDDSIRFWVTDDDNKIVLKAKADMFIGSAGVEILSFANLRNPITSYVQGSN